jgi:hypothetical protein
MPGETRDEFFQRWKRDQPRRVAAHKARRAAASTPVRLLLETKDFLLGFAALMLVVLVAAAAVWILLTLIASLVGDAWPWLAGIVVIMAASACWTRIRRG